jgi:hypothetical protein
MRAGFWWLIRALALAIVVIVLIWCTAVGTRLSWTLALACSRVKHLPVVAPKLLGTLALAGFRIEYLTWIRAFKALIGARTPASILVKYLGCWAVFLPEAGTVTCFIVEGLAVGTILDPWAGTLAIPTIELIRSITCSFVIALTPACGFVEDSRSIA